MSRGNPYENLGIPLGFAAAREQQLVRQQAYPNQQQLLDMQRQQMSPLNFFTNGNLGSIGGLVPERVTRTPDASIRFSGTVKPEDIPKPEKPVYEPDRSHSYSKKLDVKGYRSKEV